MKKQKLSKICQIISGYSFRSRIIPISNGNFKIVQAKDIDDNLSVNSQTLASILIDNPNTSAIVKNNDVLLTSRGKHKASVINTNAPTIASSSVFIIRPTSKILNPYFLAIFLNSDFAQKQMVKLTSGRYIPSISKSNLEGLVVKVPSQDQQQNIINLYRNVQNQKILLSQKIKIISDISNASLVNI